MKVRLSRTLSILMFTCMAGLFAVLGLAYRAGSISAGRSILDFLTFPQEAMLALAGAALLAATLGIALIIVLRTRVVQPVEQVAEYSDKLARGDANAGIKLPPSDDFNVIVENFRRAAAKVSDPESQAALEKSISQFL